MNLCSTSLNPPAYSGGTDGPGELSYNFSTPNELTQMTNFPTCSPDCDTPLLWLWLLFSFNPSICSIRKLWSCCCLNFHWLPFKPKRGSPLHRSGYDFHVPIRTVFVIIWEMFHGTMSLNSVLPLLVLNFVRWSRWELMYISLIVSMRLSLIHSYGFQLVVLLS